MLRRCGVGGRRPVHLDDAVALGRGRRLAGEDAERLVERPGQHLAARRREAVDGPLIRSSAAPGGRPGRG